MDLDLNEEPVNLSPIIEADYDIEEYSPVAN
jgi:hypothetical protein